MYFLIFRLKEIYFLLNKVAWLESVYCFGPTWKAQFCPHLPLLSCFFAILIRTTFLFHEIPPHRFLELANAWLTALKQTWAKKKILLHFNLQVLDIWSSDRNATTWNMELHGTMKFKVFYDGFWFWFHWLCFFPTISWFRHKNGYLLHCMFQVLNFLIFHRDLFAEISLRLWRIWSFQI